MKVKKFYNLFSLQKRLLSIVVGLIVLFVALVSRLFYLQVVSSKSLQIKASSQWLRDLPLASNRGEIFDCNGVVLATTITTYDVYVRARNVDDYKSLAEYLSSKLQLDYEKVYKKVSNTRISESLIKMQVDEKTSLEIVNSGKKGVYLSQNVGRVYPFGNLLTQVLGYCSIDNSGQTGVENYYNKYLKGIDGKSLVQADAKGVEIENSLKYFLPSIAGEDIALTIDVQIQTALETALINAYNEHKAKSAWGVIYDAGTGGVVAMSNLPSFDLNNVPRSDLKKLNELSKNNCVVDVYEPGSTFKILTMLASLNEGITTLDEKFYCSGSCSCDGQKIKCWKSIGHGSQTLVEGFKNSCNCVFVNLALRLGTERLYKYINMLGIGQKTGIDISSESGGIIIKQDKVKNVDLARIGFGQSVAVTPLQMVRMVAGATTGKLTYPHVLTSVTNQGKITYQYQNKSLDLNISSEVLSSLNNMLFNNVNADNKCSFVPGYKVGGKTGTAQKFVNGHIAQGKYVSSCFCVYPTSKPKYVLIVCINEPSNGAYYGGVVAKPVAQAVFSKIMQIKNILPDEENDVALQPDVPMPNLIGLSVAEAMAILKTLNLSCDLDGVGGVVINQLPLENTMLFAGDEVLIEVSEK